MVIHPAKFAHPPVNFLAAPIPFAHFSPKNADNRKRHIVCNFAGERNEAENSCWIIVR